MSDLISRHKAQRSGAIPIRHVKGRLPLNFDVLLDWAKSGSEEEVGRMMVLLGREYGGTYNTRVLGEDSVRLIRKIQVEACKGGSGNDSGAQG